MAKQQPPTAKIGDPRVAHAQASFEGLALQALRRQPRGVRFFLAAAFLAGWLTIRPEDWPEQLASAWQWEQGYWISIKGERAGSPEKEWRLAFEAGIDGATLFGEEEQ